MWLSRFQNLIRGPRCPRQPAPKPRRMRPNLERLEDRTLPSNYIAASVSDLIADINASNQAGGSNTILLAPKTIFDLTAVNNTTNGANGLPVIAKNDNLTITGQGGDIIQRDPAAPAFRLFDVASGGSLTLNDLTLQYGVASGSGSSAEGGAIYNQGSLTLNGVTVQNNSAQGSGGSSKKNGQDAAGGGIWSSGNLTLTNGTVIQSNQAVGGSGTYGTSEDGGNAWGGGVYINSGSANVSANLNNNSARAGAGGYSYCFCFGSGCHCNLPPGGNGGSASGGGLAVTGGSLTLTSALLENNSAAGGGGGYGSPSGSGGNGSGGGLYAGSSTTVSLCGDIVVNNSASGGGGSPSGQGQGGGIYGPKSKLSLDSYSVTNTSNNTASVDPNIDGSYTLQTCAMIEISGFPSPTTAGALDNFTVTVLNTAGATWTNYTGTVHFASSDLQAVLPADYTFTNADKGIHSFTAALKTAGTQSLTVSDKNTPTLTSTDWNITVNPAAVSQLVVAGFPSVTAGVTGFITVSADDPYGNIAPSYTGPVAFTSSAAQAALPANYTFTASDAGVHTFSASLQTAGTQSITATDTAKSSITGTQSGIAISPANPIRFTVAAPANATIGTPFSITVTAWDAYSNVATNYTGTVSFTSTDGAAVLPAPYTFTTADQGVHTFTNGVTLKTSGTQTITATGTAVPAGIVSWWPGDGNTNDVIGSNNGSLVGGATYGTGLVNQAFNFPSAGAEFVAPANGLPTGNSDRTVELWVYINAFTTTEAMFSSYGDFGIPNEAYGLGAFSSTGAVYFSQWGLAITGPSLQLGTWYHVAVTNVGNFETLYLNGVPVASGTLPLNTPSGANFYMGTVPSPYGSTRQLDGLTDEAAVYNRALSPAEIQWIYNTGSVGKHQTITGSASVSVGTSTASPLLASNSTGGAPADPVGRFSKPSTLTDGLENRPTTLADTLFTLLGNTIAAGTHPMPQDVVVNGPPSATAPLPRFNALLNMGISARAMELPDNDWLHDLLFASLL